MTDLDDARSSAWYVLSPPDGTPARDVFNRGFDAGARWAIRHSARLSPHVAKFIDLLIILGIDDASKEK